MFKSNASFGNSIVLAGYAGLRQFMFPPTINGFVQPDLTAVAGTQQSRGIPTFVWGTASLAERRRAGLRNHSPIGAPWLYLLEQESQNRIPQYPLSQHLRPVADTVGDVLYFPHHGLAGVHAAREKARQISANYPQQAVTVALTHEQYASAETVAAYSDAGLNPISLGPTVLDVGVAQPYLLHRLLLLMRTHRRAVCDVLGQWALFAHTAGLPVTLTGPEQTSVGKLNELARMHLGTDCVMPASELRALFDWSHHA